MSRHLRMLAALLAMVALLGAGCGNDDAPGGDGGTNGGGGTPLTTLDNEFSPTSVTVATGGSIDIQNDGANEHNFSVTDQDISEDIEPGGSVSVTIDLDAGTYDFFCEYHESLGMTGSLTVT